MASFPLVSATGMLGSGFHAESLDKAISLGARMIPWRALSLAIP